MAVNSDGKTIANLILEYLEKNPDGGTTDQIYDYCVMYGAVFVVSDTKKQNKSVSGQLSKMVHKRGIVSFEKVGRKHLWKLIK